MEKIIGQFFSKFDHDRRSYRSKICSENNKAKIDRSIGQIWRETSRYLRRRLLDEHFYYGVKKGYKSTDLISFRTLVLANFLSGSACGPWAHHFVEFVVAFLDSFSIGGVDDENKSLRVLVIMSPEGSDFVLSAYVPDGKRNVLVFYCLHVES